MHQAATAIRRIDMHDCVAVRNAEVRDVVGLGRPCRLGATFEESAQIRCRALLICRLANRGLSVNFKEATSAVLMSASQLVTRCSCLVVGLTIRLVLTAVWAE